MLSMAATKQADHSKQHKLSRLPLGVKVSKRPLMHGPVASPYAGRQQPKVVYLSSKTPFMSAFKHVKQLLKHIEKRDTERDLSQARRKAKRGSASKTFSTQPEDGTEPVFVKATGKAIDKALQLALFLQQQQDLHVKIKTGSVDAIDDLVQKPAARGNTSVLPDADDMDVEGDPVPKDAQPDLDELPEARIRHASMLEIEVLLRR